MAAHKHHEHKPGLAFVRAGRYVVNLEHVVSADLPADDAAPLTLHLTNGNSMTFDGEDAAAVLEALGECCEVEPAKKAAKKGE